jgi:hypothetical protein
MGGLFSEPPYPPLQTQDFGPAKQYLVAIHNGGRTIVIGDPTDAGFQKTHTLVQHSAFAVDVVIHGLPGRFIEKLGGSREIPVAVVAWLLESAGVTRGTPLRLLTCHAAEAPLSGAATAQQLATEWNGSVQGANGLLRIRPNQIEIDLVDWSSDPLGGMIPNVTAVGQGSWIPYNP